MANGLNAITREVSPGSVFESAVNVISSAVSLQSGDLVTLNTSSHLLAAPTAESDGSTFLGIQPVTIVSGVIPSPYNSNTTSSQAVADIPGPQYGVIAKVLLKAGDTLSPGSLVYIYPTIFGNRGVQASGTKAIGVYQGAAVTGGPSDTPTSVEVLLGHRFPGDVLSF